MSRSSSWSSLAHAPRRHLERVEAAALLRFAREELPLAAHYAALLALRPGVRSAEQVSSLPATAAAELAADPRAFVLRPTAAAIRSQWPFARKLALSLAGRRGRVLLAHGYGVAKVERAAPPGGPELELIWTPHDLDLLAEAGARTLDLFGLAANGVRATSALAFDAGPAFWQTTLGTIRAGARCTSTGGPRQLDARGHVAHLEQEESTALIATPGVASWILSEAAASERELPRLETVVLAATRVSSSLRAKIARALERVGAGKGRIAQLWAPPGARMALASCPTPAREPASGLHGFPDLLVLERVEAQGQILLSTVAAHGSALLRFETGIASAADIEREPCPACGRSLPRLAGDLAPLGSSSLADELDGLEDLLAWRVVPGEDALAVDLVCAEGAGGRSLEQRVADLAAAALGPIPLNARLNSAAQMLDWLGTVTEREERYVARGSTRTHVPAP